MTRKDFELIARMLGSSLNKTGFNSVLHREFAANCAVFLQKTNPRFDSDRFVNAVLTYINNPVKG